jgi:hypothetical protein
MLSRPDAPRPFGAIAMMRQGCNGDATDGNCDIELCGFKYVLC